MEKLSFELIFKMLSENPNVVLLIIVGALFFTFSFVIIAEFTLGFVQSFHDEDTKKQTKQSEHRK